MISAARSFKRVVQVGPSSAAPPIPGRRPVKSGSSADPDGRAWAYLDWKGDIGGPRREPPPELDYDLWLGRPRCGPTTRCGPSQLPLVLGLFRRPPDDWGPT
jgi:hypothetical protein